METTDPIGFLISNTPLIESTKIVCKLAINIGYIKVGSLYGIYEPRAKDMGFIKIIEM